MREKEEKETESIHDITSEVASGPEHSGGDARHTRTSCTMKTSRHEAVIAFLKILENVISLELVRRVTTNPLKEERKDVISKRR